MSDQPHTPEAATPDSRIVDLGSDYTAVPYSAVTLNGMFLPQLLPPPNKTWTYWAVIGPCGRALQGETNSTYRYESLQEAKDDVVTLLKIKETAAQ